jgi:KaiC/GvpD/RAD55 family RecA-like ATPase
MGMPLYNKKGQLIQSKGSKDRLKDRDTESLQKQLEEIDNRIMNMGDEAQKILNTRDVIKNELGIRNRVDKKYHVHVYKVDSLSQINIRARSPEEARKKALNQAKNILYGKSDTEFIAMEFLI